MITSDLLVGRLTSPFSTHNRLCQRQVLGWRFSSVTPALRRYARRHIAQNDRLIKRQPTMTPGFSARLLRSELDRCRHTTQSNCPSSCTRSPSHSPRRRSADPVHRVQSRKWPRPAHRSADHRRPGSAPDDPARISNQRNCYLWLQYLITLASSSKKVYFKKEKKKNLTQQNITIARGASMPRRLK